MAITKKPCEGCGKPGPRNAGEVCGTCKRLLQQAREFIPQYEAEMAASEAFTVMDGEKWKLFGGELSRAQLHKMCNTLAAVVSLIGVPDTGDKHRDIFHYLPEHDIYGGACAYRCAAPKAREAVRAMREAISEALNLAYANGVEYGRSLLKQLAAGEISSSDFNANRAKRSWEL